MRVDIPREMFKWARERANLDDAALVKRFPQLTEWEAGNAQPTLTQLERFAKATYGARVGKRFARALVTRALEGLASFTEAYRLLGVRRASAFDDLGRKLGVVCQPSEELVC